MRCEELRGLLDLYLDGELPEESARRIDRHLLRCQGCAYEARTLEQTVAMLREAVSPAEALPAFHERTAARLQDAFSSHLRPNGIEPQGRQWKLPHLHEERV